MVWVAEWVGLCRLVRWGGLVVVDISKPESRKKTQGIYCMSSVYTAVGRYSRGRVISCQKLDGAEPITSIYL